MYKRMTEQHSAGELLMHNGFISIEFSANLAVIKTRAGYASSLAYDIDSKDFDEILGTIAGDDTIFVLLRTEIQAKEFAGSFAKLMETGGF